MPISRPRPAAGLERCRQGRSPLSCTDWSKTNTSSPLTSRCRSGQPNQRSTASPTAACASTLEENIWDRTINVNLKGTYLGCKYAIPEMQKVGGGSIINASSIAAVRVGRGASDAYTAAKGGIVTITRTLAVEHAQYQIRCNCIIPGAIHTPLAGPFTPEYEKAVEGHIPLGRWGQPEDVAKMALFLACADSSWITGQFFVVDGGYTAV